MCVLTSWFIVLLLIGFHSFLLYHITAAYPSSLSLDVHYFTVMFLFPLNFTRHDALQVSPSGSKLHDFIFTYGQVILRWAYGPPYLLFFDMWVVFKFLAIVDHAARNIKV